MMVLEQDLYYSSVDHWNKNINTCMTSNNNRRFSVYFSERTTYFLDHLQLANRSDYIEEAVLKEWAASDCEHDVQDLECPTCYARQVLANRKPRKDMSGKSGIQSRRKELCSEWLTVENLKQANQTLASMGYVTRQLVEEEQQTVFLQAPFTHWGVYIAGLALTLDGKAVFGAKDLRQKLQGLLGELWDTPGAKAGSLLPSEALEGNNAANGYDCLRIVGQGKRPKYVWIGFKAED